MLDQIQNLNLKINWYYIIYVILAIIFVVIGYILFKNFSSKADNQYVENRNYSSNENMKSAEIILFYVDWCPHCKTAKPEWDKVKEQYQGKIINGYTIIFTEQNCTDESKENEELLNKFKIEGYPTIKLIKDNQVIEFDASPSSSHITDFLNSAI